MEICLAINYGEDTCKEQCYSCRRYQDGLENPKKASKEARNRIRKNYELIMKNAKL